mgnify:CR=1 FL=1
MSDLIAAIATGSAATAIGIVRLCGDGCFALCDRVFRPRNGKPFASQPSHKMVFGEMLDETGAVIDQGLAVRFGGGHSYTGEDAAEFHCHGSPVVLHALLSAARTLGYERVICAFQPHTYSRTAKLFDRFVEELKLADVAILAEIYAAREQNTMGISSADLARNIPGSVYCSTLDKVTAQLRELARPGDLILTVGAGDIYRAGEKLLSETED